MNELIQPTEVERRPLTTLKERETYNEHTRPLRIFLMSLISICPTMQLLGSRDRGPTLNPHPHLPRMREIATAADVSSSTATVVAAFQPLLDSASAEEWQLLIQYGWDNLVGPLEWQLFEVCTEVINVATQYGHACSQVRSLQDTAFTLPPDITNFMTWRIDPTVDRRHLLSLVISALVFAEMTRKKVAAVRKHLQDWRQIQAKRDSLISETDASNQAQGRAG